MKRSEMIKLIKGLFDIASNHDNETNAENLLCHLEELGMLPPNIHKLPELTKIGKFLEKLNFKIQRFSYEFEDVNEWEPENNNE